MFPSQVRRMILDDHRWLRELLADAEDTARQVEAGDHALTGRLRERAQAMRERFLAHLDLEETHLVPALREADAWGEERSARLLREHAEQRERFAALLAALRGPCGDAPALARDVRALVADLLTDMEHEEATLLADRVLHDDPVVVDGEPE
jgi:hemerythrin-like domain-containing protein